MLKCLVVDRDQRYQTAAEIIRDLDGWLGDPATFRTEVDWLAPLSPTVLADRRIGPSPEGRCHRHSRHENHGGIQHLEVDLTVAGGACGSGWAYFMASTGFIGTSRRDPWPR